MNTIFKKKSIPSLSSQDIANVFSEFSQSDLFLNEGYSTDWLWHQFNLMQYFLLKSASLTLVEVENILNLKVQKENFPVQVENSYQWLKKETFNSPILISFIPILLTLFSQSIKVRNYKLNIGDYLKSITNVLVIGIVTGLAFYFSFYNSFLLTLVLFLTGYFIIKKLMSKLKEKKVKDNIHKKIKKIDTLESSEKYHQLLNILSKLDLNSLDQVLKSKIDTLKKQSIRISKFLDSTKSPEFIAIWIDVEKIWLQHIPLLIEKYDADNRSSELILKTLNAMEFVLEKHMEDIFWNNNLQISSKEKYWLSKVNREYL